MRTVIIPQNVFLYMTELAALVLPNEACGFLTGQHKDGGTILSVFYPMPNTSPTPENSYVMWPSPLQFIIEHGLPSNVEVVALFHSHPNEDLKPSKMDLEWATNPSCVYLIGCRHGLKAYSIEEETATELSINVRPYSQVSKLLHLT